MNNFVIPQHLYRVARNPNGDLRWWSPQEIIPLGHTEQRVATSNEIILMQQIEATNAQGEMPLPELGASLDELMHQYHT